MKKLLCVILSCLMLVGLAACGGSEQAQQTPEAGLQVGFARENITPDYSVPLQGGDYRQRWS